MNARDQLASYLKMLQKRLRLGTLLRGAAALLAVALTATLVLVLITNAFGFSDSSLFAARIALVIALATVVGYGVALPWRALNDRRAARKVEAVFPQFDQRLVTFAERDQGGRDPFLELLAADTLQVAKSVQPAYLIPNRRLLAWIASAAASLGILVWMIAAGPGFLGYGAARLWAGSLQHTAPFYDIQVSPGNAAVRRSANQLVTAEVIGRQVESARLYARYQSTSKWEEVTMQRQHAGNGFQFLFAGLPESVDYYVEAGPLRSRNFKLRVVDLPSVKQIRVTYHFPGWTGMKDAVEEHGGDLRALEGTEARLNIFLSLPAVHTFLALDGGKQIDLSDAGHNSYNGAVTIEKDGMYHVAALDQGQAVRLSEDFFIEARKVNPPMVRITRPAGEYHASPIEEVTISVQAEDEFGLNALALHYSVNGGPEQTSNLLKQKGAKQADGSTTLSLEDFKLVPGDLVSLYASAKDARAESRTDMMFIQAEPFSRDYSQSQIMGGGGGGMGNFQEQISQREKEIIAETWKHELEKTASPQDLAEAAKFLSGVQAKLRDQALSLAGRLERRELTEENAEFSSFQKDMGDAAKAMDPAAKALQQQKWREAMPQEQKALQSLLRAEATFRQIEVAFGSVGAGGGGGGSGRDLQSLFDLELDTEKNQYETEQTAGSADQRSDQIDKALQKLDELARRQEQLAQQPRNSQDFQSRWQQEMLRREAEKLQEQMAQMARNGAQQGTSGSQQSASGPQQGNSGSQQGGSGSSSRSSSRGGQSGSDTSIQQALERLQQANDDMRRAASPGQNGADARRAADRLREASDLLNSLRGQDASQQLDSLARQGERLSGEQHDQVERMRRAFDPATAARRSAQGSSEASPEEMEKLAGDRQRLADDLANLQKRMQDATRSLASADGTAATKLRDALAGMDESNLQAKLQRSAEMIRRGMDPNTNPGEAAINSGIEHLNEQLRQAQQSLGNGQQNPEEALQRMARLRSQIDMLTRNPGDRGGQARDRSAQVGERGGQGGEPGGQQQTGDRAAGGDLRNGVAGGNDNGGRWDGDRFYGGYDPGSLTKAQGTERKPVPITQADIERAYQEALRDLNSLRQTVRSEPGPLGDIKDLQRELDHLDPRRFPGNPAMLQELHAQVLASMDKLELQLRRAVDDKKLGQVRTGDAQRVPDGYQDSVADYFRRLSKPNK
jgi:hypothetical protein